MDQHDETLIAVLILIAYCIIGIVLLLIKIN